jgi:nitrogen regulatory protein PII
MQLISAIVRPTKVGEICDALQHLGFQRVTVTDAIGLGKLRGPTEIYRGAKYSSESASTPSSKSSPATRTPTTCSSSSAPWAIP